MCIRDSYYSNPRHAKGRGVQVTISCACFVPKPHTPFQFVPMDTEAVSYTHLTTRSWASLFPALSSS